MTSRRDFFKIVAGGITFSLLPKTNIPAEAKTITPAVSELGKELTKSKLWEPGWHTVKITDVNVIPSRLDPSQENFWLSLESLDGKDKITKILSPKAPHFAAEFLGRAGIHPDNNQSICLNDAIGKTVKVKIGKTTRGIRKEEKEFNTVD